MKLVVCSDAHGDAATAGLDRYDDVEGALLAVAEASKRERADLFLFLGDLTDPGSSRSHRAVALAASVANDLRRAGIQSRWLVGNHDVVEDGRGTSTLSPLAGAGFVVHGRPAAEALGSGLVAELLLVALPYPPRTSAYDPDAFVRTVPETFRSTSIGKSKALPVVVAGHLMIPAAGPGSESADFARGRDVFFPLEACRAVCSPGALLLNGHYHRRQRASGVEIPGSLARLRFDEEAHEPGFLVCETAGAGEPWRVRFERLRARSLWTIGPSSVAWRGDHGVFPRGAIVRLRPGAEETDQAVAETKAKFERSGAAKVLVEPRPSAGDVLPAEERERSAPDRETPRQAVAALAAVARADDRNALEAALDAELSAAGL